MSASISLTPVSPSKARLWLQNSLVHGDGLSAAVLRRISLDSGLFAALIPATVGRIPPFEKGGVTSTLEADTALAEVLNRFATEVDVGVVVENDVLRRGDDSLADLPFPSAYIENRVLHWQRLSWNSGASAAAVLRRGAFGYPTNGFLLAASALDALSADADIDLRWCQEAAELLHGIVVSAFDAESFLLWLTPSLTSLYV